MEDQWLEIFIKKEELKYFGHSKTSEGLGKIDHLGGEHREGGGEGTRDVFRHVTNS